MALKMLGENGRAELKKVFPDLVRDVPEDALDHLYGRAAREIIAGNAIGQMGVSTLRV